MRLPAVLTATAGTSKPLAAACRFAPANVSMLMWAGVSMPSLPAAFVQAVCFATPVGTT